MTLRYMKHAPENYFTEEAARVAASLSGAADREAHAQAELARPGSREADPPPCATNSATSQVAAAPVGHGGGLHKSR